MNVMPPDWLVEVVDVPELLGEAREGVSKSGGESPDVQVGRGPADLIIYGEL